MTYQDLGLLLVDCPQLGVGEGLGIGVAFQQVKRDGWQHEQPDHWLARPDPWEVARCDEAVQVPLACSFDIRAGALRVVRGRPSTLIGIPFDRPVVGYGHSGVGEVLSRLFPFGVVAPGDLSQFAQGIQFGELGLVVCVGNGAGPQAVA